MREEQCIFCKIVSGEIPSERIYEDDRFISILDLSPATRGHALLIPKDHFGDAFALSDEVAKEVLPAAKKVAALLCEKLQADGLNMIQNNGEVAGQTVLHYHLHLIPRYRKDTVQITWPTPPQADPEALKAVLSELRS